MSHFDPEKVSSVHLNEPHSCRCYFWVCCGLPSTSHLTKQMALLTCQYSVRMMLSYYCYAIACLYTITLMKLIRLPGKCYFVYAALKPPFFSFIQPSRSVCTAVGLALSSLYLKTAPNVSLINESHG